MGNTFNAYHHDRPTRGGGVLTYVNDQILTIPAKQTWGGRERCPIAPILKPSRTLRPELLRKSIVQTWQKCAGPPLCAAVSTFQAWKAVRAPTRGRNILGQILTNMPELIQWCSTSANDWPFPPQSWNKRSSWSLEIKSAPDEMW